MKRIVLRTGSVAKREASKGKTAFRMEAIRGETGEFSDLEGRIGLIQALIPLGLEAVAETLEQEVRALAGDRYRRDDGQAGVQRWGSQTGSVYLGDQKLPIEVPRLRDTEQGREIGLLSYRKFREPRNLDEGLLKRIVQGLSCRNYRACAEAVPEAFGMSPSTISRRVIRASETVKGEKVICKR